MTSERTFAVYCGSRDGVRPVFREAASAFGTAMAKRGVDLVYGGAQNGLMGAVANAVLAGGRRAIGVIPKGLDRLEFAHPKLTERIDVPTMHVRKEVMANRATAFVALAGGFGTMDELFETITFRQIGAHQKPVGLLDTGGFYESLFRWMDRAVEEGLAPAELRASLICTSDPDELAERLVR